MKKTIPTLLIAALAAAAFAAPAPNAAKPRASQNHVPAALDASIRPFFPRAAKRPHVALVNVGGAIPEDIWALATTYAVSRLQINVWTNSIPTSVLDRLVADPGYTKTALCDTNALIGVYFERRPSGCTILASPASWSVVNVAPFLADATDPQQIRDRYAKLVMKGLATACGSGNTLEPFCSMFYGAQNPAGMDRTNIALVPMAYFPMLETLRGVGGVDMATACQSAEENP